MEEVARRSEQDFALKDAVGLFNSNLGIQNTLWAAYVAVAIGLINVVLGKIVNINTVSLGILTAGFLVFSMANLKAIMRTRKILVSIAGEIRAYISEADSRGAGRVYFYPSLKYVSASAVKDTVALHLLLDVIVIGVLWSFYLAGKATAP
jgi:hypothetical protein